MRCSDHGLHSWLGEEFELLDNVDEIHPTPAGATQPATYCLPMRRQRSGIPLPGVPRYIGPMRRSLVSRIAGLAIATLVGISAPGLAYAHGYAHHEASEHAGADHVHGDAVVTDGAAGMHDERPMSVQGTSESTEHPHVQLAHALLGRMDAPLFILPSVPAIPGTVICVSTAALVLSAARACIGPADAPPSQPRAPPLG